MDLEAAAQRHYLKIMEGSTVKQVTTQLVDDIDESPAERTFTFAIENRAFEIDLSVSNIAAFHEAVGRFVDNARSAGKVATVARGGGNGKARVDREQIRGIREWARKHGHNVSDRGRISAKVMAAFNSEAGSQVAS